MTAPVLFLDVDGVLNCRTTTERFKGAVGIDRHLAQRVRDIVRATGAEVVVSSSWRCHGPWLAEVRRFFRIAGVTPDLRGVGKRGDEITAWLAINPRERYAIVDDDADMLPDQLPHFFRCSSETGITEDIAAAIVGHLVPRPSVEELLVGTEFEGFLDAPASAL